MKPTDKPNEPSRRVITSVPRQAAQREAISPKSAEQLLTMTRDELERLIQERTSELARANERLTQELAEHQEMQAALRASEEKYKELAELLPQIVFEIDGRGNFRFVNCGGLKSVGYTRKEFERGLSLFDIVAPEDREQLANDIEVVLKGQKLSGKEYTLEAKSGATFPVLMYSARVMRDGRATGMRGIAVDITDLRRAQKKLWIKDSAIASSINAIVITDLDGRLTYVNPSFLELWGYESAKEILGRSALDLWDQPQNAREVIRLLGWQGWWIGAFVARRKDGSTFHAEGSTTRVTDESGKPTCLMGSFLDITDRKLAEDALRSSEERFRAVFEGAKDCIYIKDRALKYTHVNRAVEKLLGLSAQEILGRRAEDIFGREAGTRINEVNLRALSGESIEEEHTRPVRGEQLTFHEVTVPLRNAEREIVGVCTISRNITERKKSQTVRRISERTYPSPAMQATLQKARYAAARDGIVLLLGESGSGKDYFAHWIHNHSRRANGPFFSINCAALPHDLAESELFGHEPGAFTGARARKRGLLELAEGGTLLLNEVGELSLALQSKLLTFLDERSFLRVGGVKSIHVNARLIAATNKDLESEVASGRFLQALYYRLNVFPLRVPPLRERVEDIPLLVEELLSVLASEMQFGEIPTISPATMKALSLYLWPGNVRELRNVLERSLMLWDKGELELTIPTLDSHSWLCVPKRAPDGGLHAVTDKITRSLCREALASSAGSKKEAARILGISRNSLYRYMKRFGMFENGTRH
ncbi:MAG: sigma 54-interacting transcriptional regulator [Desulfomonile sp.]|nr:sigma 54-interacting transcriptional regulator [Desulfomonile sp.]